MRLEKYLSGRLILLSRILIFFERGPNKRSRTAQALCVISALRFGKLFCDNCFKGLSGVEACGGGDLTLVTGYYRPGRRGLQGWVEFHSGGISP